MNAEPEKIFINEVDQPKKLQTGENAPKITTKKSEENAEVKQENSTEVKREDITEATTIEPNKTTQPIDNSITLEETDNTENTTTNTIFSDIAEKDLTPEVIAAIKIYEGIQPAQDRLNAELKPLLDAEPLDMDAIDRITDEKIRLSHQRLDSLVTLSPYSKEAFNKVVSKVEQELSANERMIELTGETVEYEENITKLNRTIEKLKELQKSNSTISRTELEQILAERK